MTKQKQLPSYLVELNRQKHENLLTARKKDTTGSRLFVFRTSGQGTPCEICSSMENKTGTLEVLEKLGAIPPMHPNCRCKIEISSFSSYKLANSFELKYGQEVTELNTAESQYIMTVQLRLQSLGLLDRKYSKYGYFGDETVSAVNLFVYGNRISSGSYPQIHPHTNIVDEETWEKLGLGDRPDASQFAAAFVPNAEAIALAREMLDKEYNTQHDSFWLHPWKSNRLTFTKTYADKLNRALSNQVQAELLAALADPFVAGLEGKSLPEIIIGILDPEPGISDIIEATLGKSLSKSVEKASKQLDAINASPLRYVTSATGVFREEMKLDAFKAIDEINKSNHPQSVKDEAIMYIINIIRLCYDKKAREASLKSVLDGIK